ncbi:hypothetical protein BFJ68_g16157 [Fusarium oxysporum]|uniref:Uncharacterized protein n=2 Tax=Fusarium oxysporum TaxID=5507 RepID=A0A420PGH2_FUSOX|nr:hypothetical protein BFJ65_g5720 [Fusarium oxysporum f. sp. cepae]RKK26530.1 hypothetical protein BFJ67_g16607 [Fusarium oxysporum f. sp. cepae]RKK30718.1 hypothetical protein BFJ66_g16183 [Fusarium oxysporum f. sp. cepae]RKK87037.1 hypothetical protein BFJ71_g13496 [Fusarium oxysporum]RKK91617.1 hypothetical protein BFJ68_g16157 [Fusarium oxysporum]
MDLTDQSPMMYLIHSARRSDTVPPLPPPTQFHARQQCYGATIWQFTGIREAKWQVLELSFSVI